MKSLADLPWGVHEGEGKMPIIRRQELPKKKGSSPGVEICRLVDAALGSRFLSIEETTVAPNSRIPRHIHANTEEAMIILEGTVDVILGRQRTTVGAGQTVLAPAGAIHGFVNRYQEPARMLCVSPAREVEEVPVSGERENVGFASEKGLTAHRSAGDRPLDKG